MSLSKLTTDLDIIQQLDDEPNDVGGLTATELKATFDEGGEAVKEFLNGVLIPALDTYIARTDNPHAVTKAQVGLGLADNTADVDKPVSTAQQAAINAVVLGQIQDGTLTEAKLVAEVQAAIDRAKAGGEIDAALDSKAEIELLDNTDFTNPIAQAGVGGLHGSVAYALDRWKLISGTVSASSNGLTLNGTIRQIREKSIGFAVVPSIEMHSGTAAITYDDTTKYCDITSSGGTVKRPHLGLRAITEWSKMRTADFGAELWKCQRHYEAIPDFRFYMGARNPWSIATQINKIPFKVAKRTIPVVTFEYEKSSNPGVWVAATASHTGTDGFTDVNTAFDCDFVNFRNVVATAEM